MAVLDVVVLGVALTGHLTAAGYAYLDAPEHGMDAVRWGLLSVAVPAFGFFAYLFEREERNREDDEREEFSDGIFEVHDSRADDTPFAEGSGEYKYGPEDDDE